MWTGHYSFETQSTPGDVCCSSDCGGWGGGVWSDALITPASSGYTGIVWTMPYNGYHAIVGLTTLGSIGSYTHFTHAVYYRSGNDCYSIADGTWGTPCVVSCYNNPATEWKIQAVSASSLAFSYKCPGSAWVVWMSQSWNGQPLRAAVDIYSVKSDCLHGPRGMAWI